MKPLFLVLIISLVLISGIGIVNATINITPSEISHNYIKWEWETGAALTGISIDGKIVPNFDPLADSYILSNLNPEELHQITVYRVGDSGTNTTETNPTPAGDLPLGIWIYGIPAILALVVARYSKLAVINVFSVMFSLFGIYQLLNVKSVMDSGLWTISLIFYTILMIVGLLAWGYQAGRLGK